MTQYPDVDVEISGYVACVMYDGDTMTPIRFPGSYEVFIDAAARSRKIVQALRAAGESGVRPYVHFTGERPHDFPRNGVML